ncbi:Protein of unknown function [Cotesia congregata]|uniref:Uncharacterized protein n=1 Tax=Cotesia congregata TaxID=51543 RepID=A0A8J2H8Y7_COTCN|nr:Protein of unknown function [Cotesia congregata]
MDIEFKSDSSTNRSPVILVESRRLSEPNLRCVEAASLVGIPALLDTVDSSKYQEDDADRLVVLLLPVLPVVLQPEAVGRFPLLFLRVSSSRDDSAPLHFLRYKTESLKLDIIQLDIIRLITSTNLLLTYKTKRTVI